MKISFISLSKKSIVTVLSLVTVLGLDSCERSQEPVSVNSEKGSARVINCPVGQHWDFDTRQCVNDGANDIDPNSISYNTSASNTVTWWQHTDVKVKITPGTLNGQTYHLCELYNNTNSNAPYFTGESIIIKMNSSGSTSYYDTYGQKIGVMFTSTNSSGTTFISFNPEFTGDPNARFFNAWGKCVGKTLGTMASGTAIGSFAALGCMAFGPECAVTIGISCAAAVTIWNY